MTPDASHARRLVTLAGTLLTRQAIQRNRFPRVWRTLGIPTDLEWTEYLRRWGGLRHLGSDVTILRGTVITDPAWTWIGDNVILSACTLVGHDASHVVMQRAYGGIFDSVGYIVIKDNVFVGWGAVVLPNVSIGPNALVAAGAIVTKDVPPNSVVGGSPARVIGSLDELAVRRREATRALPWYDLLVGDQRRSRDILLRRSEHFFGPGGVSGVE